MNTITLISIIVPLYYGTKYIENIISMISRNLLNLNGRCRIELIFVNDSPDENINQFFVKENEEILIIFLNNEYNSGIHCSRVKGLEIAKGDFILFLDQDDIIEDNYIIRQLSKIRKNDVIVANGTAQYEVYKKQLYRYAFMQWTVKMMWFHTYFGCRIISPGQCLIRRSCIPDIWKENIMKNNGADDYFLWLLLLQQNAKFAINRDKLYVHVYTTENASLNNSAMELSVKEMLQKIQGHISERHRKIIVNRTSIKRRGAITKSLIRFIEKINQE